MNKYDLILFDMDGTIADTDDVIVDSFIALYDELNIKKRKTREELYYYSGPSLKTTLPKEFPGYDLEFLLKRYREISVALYKKEMKLYKDEIEVLSNLKKAGFKLGIVTNKVRSSSNITLEILGITDLFDCMVCFDEIKNGKPNPEGIQKAMEIMNITEKQRVIYVGDNEIDYQTAANSNVDSMLVTWGPRKLNRDLNVTYFVSSFKEMEGVFVNG